MRVQECTVCRSWSIGARAVRLVRKMLRQQRVWLGGSRVGIFRPVQYSRWKERLRGWLNQLLFDSRDGERLAGWRRITLVCGSWISSDQSGSARVDGCIPECSL